MLRLLRVHRVVCARLNVRDERVRENAVLLEVAHVQDRLPAEVRRRATMNALDVLLRIEGREIRAGNRVDALAEIEERVEELMLTQQDVAFERNEGRVGAKFDVLIDDYGEDGIYPARHEGQAPEVDSIVYVEGGEFDPGDIVKVRCTGTHEYDLVARPADGKLPIIQ